MIERSTETFRRYHKVAFQFGQTGTFKALRDGLSDGMRLIAESVRVEQSGVPCDFCVELIVPNRRRKELNDCAFSLHEYNVRKIGAMR